MEWNPNKTCLAGVRVNYTFGGSFVFVGGFCLVAVMKIGENHRTKGMLYRHPLPSIQHPLEDAGIYIYTYCYILRTITATDFFRIFKERDTFFQQLVAHKEAQWFIKKNIESFWDPTNF